MSKPINLHEYEQQAMTLLDGPTCDYYAGGCEDEVTLRANLLSFEQVRLRPRFLVDVREVSTATTLLGKPLDSPILVAPSAYHGLAHAEGECETARGVAQAGSIFTVSTLATRSLEEVAAAAECPLWFQLYVYRDRSVSERLIARAEAAGYQALMLTIDRPWLGRRERELRSGFGVPTHLSMANFRDVPAAQNYRRAGPNALPDPKADMFDAGLTWESIAWLRSVTSLPIIVKGILTAEDALLAAEAGAAAIVVSNHGGRQIDGTVTTLEALPEVVAALAQSPCEIYIDGGIRRGSDALKALALGAQAVMLGRPVLWGLAVAGSAGVADVLTTMQRELQRSMALCGRPNLASIDRSLVRPSGMVF